MIRIILASTPPLMREIVESAVAAESDMIIVGPVQESEDLYAATTRLRADVVIVSEQHESATEPVRVLSRWCRLKLFAIARNGRRVTQYAVRLVERQSIDDISPASLVAAIRAAAKDGDTIRRHNQGEL